MLLPHCDLRQHCSIPCEELLRVRQVYRVDKMDGLTDRQTDSFVEYAINGPSIAGLVRFETVP